MIPKQVVLKGGTTYARTQTSSFAPTTITASINTSATSAEENQTDTWSAALRIISEEGSIAVAELAPEVAFADIVVDSLLSLLCASRFQEKLGLRHESSIFIENPTLKEQKQFWKQICPCSTNKMAIDGHTKPL